MTEPAAPLPAPAPAPAPLPAPSLPAPAPAPPLVLCGFAKREDAPSSSAFCQKLEAFLRATGTAYVHQAAMPQAAPKGKLPYVLIPAPGTAADAEPTVLADSHFIIRHLIATGRARDLNHGLTAGQVAESNAWQGAWEERVYPCVVYERWLDEAAYVATAQELAPLLPWPLQSVILWSIRRGIRTTLVAQGVGRHSSDDVRSFVVQAMADLAVRLEEAATRAGETEAAYFHATAGPTEVDIVLYGVLANALGTAGNPTITGLLLASPPVVRYVRLMTLRLFPEYAGLLARLGDAASPADKNTRSPQ